MTSMILRPIYFFTAIVLLCFSADVHAQENQREADEMLLELKDGALLVRLFTKTKTLELMREMGRLEELKELEAEIDKEHKEILLSFSQTFNFCPVYFFYADDSKFIRDGNLSGKVFDVGLNPVDISKIPKNIFIAEFSETPNLGIDGLIIMNQSMVPLKAPFPFYQRKHGFMGLKTYTKPEIVEMLNDKLYRYLSFQQ